MTDAPESSRGFREPHFIRSNVFPPSPGYGVAGCKEQTIDSFHSVERLLIKSDE
jgi:hypothetical protein